MISENLTSWLGRKVVDFKPLTEGGASPGQRLSSEVIYRFRLEYEDEHTMAGLFAAFTTAPGACDVTALVIGAWGGDDPSATSEEIVQLLVGARRALPKLEAIFFGDIIYEEMEMSWINQSDVSPLFSAYPGLRHFVVRGGNGLSLGHRTKAPCLQSLIVQTGGLPTAILSETWTLDAPRLEHLELWLGTDNYGWNGTVADLAPLLGGGLFPQMKTLGLRNSEIADQVAEALVTSPLMDRIENLDLSLGTLGDTGAGHLLAAPFLKHLRSLDLHHHYCSDVVMERLRQAFPAVNLADKEEGDEDERYVSVGE